MGAVFCRRNTAGVERWWIEVRGKGSRTRLVPATDELVAELARYRRVHGLAPSPYRGETRPLLLPLIGREKPLSRGAVHLIRYGHYPRELSDEDLARFFHLDDGMREVILMRRGDHNRLGFALQLMTVRYLGTFLNRPVDDVPPRVRVTVAAQLEIADITGLAEYQNTRQRRRHVAEIRERYGYREWSNPGAGFRLTRWLCALCWTGTERPGALFERATAWMLTHKVLCYPVSPRWSASSRRCAREWRPGCGACLHAALLTSSEANSSRC